MSTENKLERLREALFMLESDRDNCGSTDVLGFIDEKIYDLKDKIVKLQEQRFNELTESLKVNGIVLKEMDLKNQTIVYGYDVHEVVVNMDMFKQFSNNVIMHWVIDTMNSHSAGKFWGV